MTRIEMFQKALVDVKSDINRLNEVKAKLRGLKATHPGPAIEVIDQMIEDQTYEVNDLEESIEHEKSLPVS